MEMNLPPYIYDKFNQQKHQNSADTECVICSNIIKKGQYKITLQCCKHEYHRKCIIDWILPKKTCPMCRHSYEEFLKY